MRARVPLDVDLEDKLLYGLTPMRLAYLVGAVVMAFGVWTSNWAPSVVRGCAAVLLCAVGAVAGWGRWHGRALDRWAADVAIFVVRNHRVTWSPPHRRRQPSRDVDRHPDLEMDAVDRAT